MIKPVLIRSGIGPLDAKFYRILKSAAIDLQYYKQVEDFSNLSVESALCYGYLGNQYKYLKTLRSSIQLSQVNLQILDHQWGSRSSQALFRLTHYDNAISTTNLLTKYGIKPFTDYRLDSLLRKHQHIDKVTLYGRITLTSLFRRKHHIHITGSPILRDLSTMRPRPSLILSNSLRYTMRTYKKTQVLPTSGYELKYKGNRGRSILVSMKDISSVYCESSMMALDFILHSKPVFLGNFHPLRPFFGVYVPPLSKYISRLKVRDYLAETTISTSGLSQLLQLMHN